VKRLIPLGVAVLAAALPAAAQADVYCVNKPPCLMGTAEPDLATALQAAAQHFGPDTVVLGPRDTAYQGGIAYDGADPVKIIGSGPDESVIAAPAANVVLAVDGSASLVQGVGIRVSGQAGHVGLVLEGTGRDIDVTETAGSGGPPVGVELRGDAVLERSTMSMGQGMGVLAQDSSGAPTVRDTAVTSAGVGIRATNALQVLRTTVTSGAAGLHAFGPDANLRVDDTLVRTGNSSALMVTAGARAQARHATFASGAGSAPGVFAWSSSPGRPTALTLDSTIVSGYAVAVRRTGNAGAPADVTLAYSAWDGAVESTGDGAITDGAGNLPATTPVFVRPVPAPPLPLDFHLNAPSALIDAGNPAAATALDRDGAGRSLDGDGRNGARPDIGAFESPAVPASADGTPSAADSGDHLAPHLTRLAVVPRRLRLGDKLPALISRSRGRHIAFRLSEPARVTLRFNPAGKGKTHRLQIDGHAGVNRIRFQGRLSRDARLHVGRYALRAVARDAAGNRSPRTSIDLTTIR
jgi:hypothetical protein